MSVFSLKERVAARENWPSSVSNMDTLNQVSSRGYEPTPVGQSTPASEVRVGNVTFTKTLDLRMSRNACMSRTNLIPDNCYPFSTYKRELIIQYYYEYILGKRFADQIMLVKFNHKFDLPYLECVLQRIENICRNLL